MEDSLRKYSVIAFLNRSANALLSASVNPRFSETVLVAVFSTHNNFTNSGILVLKSSSGILDIN